MPIDLHYVFPSPPCRAVMILAKQLNIDLNLVNVDLLSGEHKKPEFEAVNPQKLVPVIVDDGFILGESRAILAYLVNQYSPGHDLYPVDAKQRAVIDRTMYLTAELFNRGKLVIKPVVYEAKWPLPEGVTDSYFELLKVLEKLASGKKFLAGDQMSIADISFICDLTVLTDVLKVDISNVAPEIQAWKERMATELEQYNELVADANKIFVGLVEGKIGKSLE